jgi:hypothetical protein
MRIPWCAIALAVVSVTLLACGARKPPDSSVPAATPTARTSATGSAAALDPRTEAGLQLLRRRPAWLFPAAECPADVAASREETTTYLSEACVPDLSTCLDRCRTGESNACYASALRVQELARDTVGSEALFLRACRLGTMSGCTNRAAGIVTHEPEYRGGDECATRTFRTMCDRQDPWACAMFGFHLKLGRGVEQDLDRALVVLRKTCSLDKDDPACHAALELIADIEASRANPATPASP